MAKKKENSTPVSAKVSLWDMSVPELNVQVKDIYRDMQKKQLEKAVGRLKNTREIFMLRKKLAKTKTALSLKSKLNSVKSTIK